MSAHLAHVIGLAIYALIAILVLACFFVKPTRP